MASRTDSLANESSAVQACLEPYAECLKLSNLGRQLTEREARKLALIFEESAYFTPTGEKEYAIINLLPNNNFQETAAGGLQGFTALLNKHAPVTPGLFGHSMFTTRALYKILGPEASGAGAKEQKHLTEAHFQNEDARMRLNEALNETLAEGELGYDIGMLKGRSGKLQESGRVPTMGELNTQVGVYTFVTREGSIEKREFYIAVDAYQEGLSEQARDAIDIAKHRQATYAEMLREQVFVHGPKIAFMGAHALAQNAARALGVTLARSNTHLLGKATVATLLNCFLPTPDENVVRYCSESADTFDQKAHGVVLFKNMATCGFLALRGPPDRSITRARSNLFRRKPWKSPSTFNCVATNVAQRFALNTEAPSTFQVKQMSKEMQDNIERRFLWQCEQKEQFASGQDEALNHALYEQLFIAPGVPFETFQGTIEDALLRTADASTALDVIELTPVSVKLSATPVCDLAFDFSAHAGKLLSSDV